MSNPIVFRLAARRFLIILVLSVLLVWLGSELAHTVLKSSFDRPPQTITLTIPDGTAVRVAAGLEEASIPSELSFVEGDTLVVYNDDSAAMIHRERFTAVRAAVLSCVDTVLSITVPFTVVGHPARPGGTSRFAHAFHRVV